ncbi:hypothetical protein HELRODRAFT_176332 [Helobdella robusta]|uniref:Uncharacterized protein n=1 Tax=Helobdella robusta TaxID=6412 RepID=T1FAE4_HELRO|nr:hypothetical protein HELRODRAFT_176332 [Helobdella robusta]ESO00027.1 hypothetical protein HELRODRAFT_176332 [Helobdella robusta]
MAIMAKLIFSIVTLVILSVFVTAEKPQLLATFSNGTPVYGLAVLKNNLIAVSRENSGKLQLYNVAINGLFTELNSVDMARSDSYYDMAYLNKSEQFVLLNWLDSNKIILMQSRFPYEVKSWNFTSDTTMASLAVTESDQTIIVTEGMSKQVKIYDPSGKLLRTIKLQMARSPRQAIRLSNNLYAVTAGYETTESHLVCRFNVKGYVVGRCFGGRPGNSINQLNVPARMVLLNDGSVLLADMKNSRILKLNKDLSSAEIFLGASDGIHQPYRLYADESKRILYVADNTLDPVTSYAVSGRVIAFRY